MLERKVRHALEVLERFKDWQHKYVMFSGGKDSLVCLDLCHKAWGDGFKVIYIEVTGNTHPECTKYVYDIVDEYGVELVHLKHGEDFFDVLKVYGYPSVFWAGSRWCMHRFKDRPMAKFVKENHLTITVSGIKPGDSPRRRAWIFKNVVGGVVSQPKKACWGRVQVYPLYNWERDDVWIYINEKALPVNPLYKEIGGAGNCLICPAMKEFEFVAVKRKCPEFFCKWRKVHEKLRQDYAEGRPRGMRVVFHRFDRWYELYCRNKTLSCFCEVVGR